ncbi:similar to Saccharomyces cerevisiae YER042W MXR1 Methionine-S-sulfoxide reductase [Geotrichum candidum]|uniref:peptide-methionine (S)-S-oxide reductase n=2 Tax=Geotrichum candidum TaxID=1173061 RepID=A0A0J9XFL4_GEOCN|nr:similar to Saccharomyces cerevisiae YER042W MXR1 Methionine-S-sulfoxide reductase [Geotrichum candidum]
MPYKIHFNYNYLLTLFFFYSCFWGTEHIYRKYFTDKGLIDCRVGYTGGLTENPNYEEICTDTTDHAEVLQISFDPKQLPLADVINFFYRMHDPTSLNKQGRNKGRQYRSAIFVHSEAQIPVIEKVKAEVQKEFYPNAPIVTEVVPVTVFWDAEDYHQLYLENNPDGYHCPSHFYRTEPKLD